MTARRPANVAVAFLARQLGIAAVVSAVLTFVSVFFLGVAGFLLFWALASLLGVVGFIASIVGLTAPGSARRAAFVGLTTSFVAVVVPAGFLVWLVRSIDWNFGGF